MKRIFTFGLLIAAAFALTNCAQKESYAPVQEETSKYVNCEVVVKLPAETKTYNEGLSTKWSDDDQLRLEVTYRKLLSSEYVTEAADNPFNHVGNGKFNGKFEQEVIRGALRGGTFKAYYPYESDGTIPSSITQNGYDSRAHLAGANCPLSGSISLSFDQDWEDLISQNRVYTLPEVTLEHTTSVIEVAVKNSTAAAINVNEVDFLVGGEVKATTTVANAGDLAAGETALVYIVVEPGTYSDLSFTVNDTIVKNINAAEATFTAGMIKKVNFVIE